MKLSVTFSETSPATHDTLIVEGKVAEGKNTVYQVFSPLHKANYALKVFEKTPANSIQYQKEQLISTLSHPNVIQHIPIQDEFSDVYAHLTEFAKYGDFFSLISRGILTKNEVLARTFFHQLIEGLEYIHSQGVSHLDLKLENLVLSSEFTLKIIDFDQSQLITDAIMTSGGTPVYRAPEVSYGTCQDLRAADIYSVGVILYILKTGEFPFIETFDERRRIRRACSHFMINNNEFWKNKAKSLGNERTFNEEFIELVNGMLECDVKKRFKINDIKSSKWFNGQVLDKKSLKIRMKASFANTKIKNCFNKSSYTQVDKKRD